MPDQLNGIERWLDKPSHSVWERNQATDEFSLIEFQEKKIDKQWGTEDIAKALNCGLSQSSDDCGKKPGFVTFPPRFNFSPTTGKPLIRAETKIYSWIPVSGSEGLISGLLRGGRITSHPLKLKGDSFLNRDPDRELPLPGHGRYRFCAGAFGLSSSFLLALDGEQGVLYCWLPTRGEWRELATAVGAPYIGTETLRPQDWCVDIIDTSGEGIIFWPSDCGLVAVKIDVLSLSYEAKLLIKGRCLSVPRMIKNMVYVLVETNDGLNKAMSVNSNWQVQSQPSELPINDIPTAKWVNAIATPREIIWLSDAGQVVLRPNAQQYLYIPWEAGVEPQFLLGGPHCASDGHLWMQVLHPTINEGEKGFCYIQLGKHNPEKRLSFGARTLTGQSSIKVEKWFRGDPWIEPTVVANMKHENDEAVLPILESTSDGTLLVLRADHLRGITQFFERTDEPIITRFQVMGQHGNEGFYVKRLREPWNASAFIFEETLFIYHPGIESIPGWLTFAIADK